MSKKLRYGLLAILTLGLLFGTIGTTAAQETRPLRGRLAVRGSITMIDENRLTIERIGRPEVSGDILIITDDNTHVHIIGQEDAGFDDQW